MRIELRYPSPWKINLLQVFLSKYHLSYWCLTTWLTAYIQGAVLSYNRLKVYSSMYCCYAPLFCLLVYLTRYFQICQAFFQLFSTFYLPMKSKIAPIKSSPFISSEVYTLILGILSQAFLRSSLKSSTFSSTL